MDFLSTWGWPQWTYAIYQFISLLVWAAMHGEPMTGKYNFMARLVMVAALVFVIAAGGFFS